MMNTPFPIWITIPHCQASELPQSSDPFGNEHIYIYTYTYIHYITLHYITWHYFTIHYITLHYITLHTSIYIYTYLVKPTLNRFYEPHHRPTFSQFLIFFINPPGHIRHPQIMDPEKRNKSWGSPIFLDNSKAEKIMWNPY